MSEVVANEVPTVAERPRTYAAQECAACQLVTPHWRFEKPRANEPNPMHCRDCGHVQGESVRADTGVVPAIPAELPAPPLPTREPVLSDPAPEQLTRRDRAEILRQSLDGLWRIANALSFLDPVLYPTEDLSRMASSCVQLAFAPPLVPIQPTAEE